jgi:hypothetical protein
MHLIRSNMQALAWRKTTETYNDSGTWDPSINAGPPQHDGILPTRT